MKIFYSAIRIILALLLFVTFLLISSHLIELVQRGGIANLIAPIFYGIVGLGIILTLKDLEKEVY